MADDELPDPFGKALRRGAPNLRPKPRRMPRRLISNVAKPRLHQLARRRAAREFLRLSRFTMHRTDRPSRVNCAIPRASLRPFSPASPQRRLHVPRLQQFDRKPHLPQRRIKPLRQWPASSPIRSSLNPSEPNQAISASGSLATFASRAILPFPSTTHASSIPTTRQFRHNSSWSSLNDLERTCPTPLTPSVLRDDHQTFVKPRASAPLDSAEASERLTCPGRGPHLMP